MADTFSVFLYCCPECPSCLAHLNSIGCATWAIWVAIATAWVLWNMSFLLWPLTLGAWQTLHCTWWSLVEPSSICVIPNTHYYNMTSFFLNTFQAPNLRPSQTESEFTQTTWRRTHTKRTHRWSRHAVTNPLPWQQTLRRRLGQQIDRHLPPNRWGNPLHREARSSRCLPGYCEQLVLRLFWNCKRSIRESSDRRHGPWSDSLLQPERRDEHDRCQRTSDVTTNVCGIKQWGIVGSVSAWCFSVRGGNARRTRGGYL